MGILRTLRLAPAAALLLAAPASAAPAPLTVTHTGYVLGSDDKPLTGMLSMKFALYPAASGGSAAWTSDGTANGAGPACQVPVRNGYYAVTIGGHSAAGGVEGACGTALTAAHVPADSPVWLEVHIGDAALSPRQVLNPAPVAASSRDAAALAARMSSAAGTINAADNPLHWSQLAGVPAGIADGVDDDTLYTAGGGLALLGTVFQIADGGVTTQKIGNLQVTGAKLADGAVTTSKLGDAQVTQAKIGPGAVGPSQLADAAVSRSKLSISAGELPGTWITNKTVGTNQLADGSVTTAQILDGTITGADIAPGTITADKLAHGAGSSLNADLLDGLDSTQFLRSDQSGTLSGALTVTGQVNVGGSLTGTSGTLTAASPVDVTGGSGTGYITAPIEIRTSETPRVSFHRPGVVAAQLGMDGAGTIRTYDNPGTGYAPFAASHLQASGVVSITSGADNDGNLRFSAANPVIKSSSYLVIPGGAYFNGGTVYAEATMQVRGGLQNDSDSYGGYVRVHDSLHVAEWVRVDGDAGLYFQSFGGGWHMRDSTWIRSYNGKPVYMEGGFDTSAASGVGCGGGMGGGFSFRVCGSQKVTGRLEVDDRIGIGTGSPAESLHTTGNIRANGTVMWGNGLSRTETRDNAATIGNQGARSGFFETSSPSNYYPNSWGWQHLIEARHSNNDNNYALQIAGSFYDQDLWFRKTNGNGGTSWSQLIGHGERPCNAPFNSLAVTTTRTVGGVTRSNTICATSWVGTANFQEAQSTCHALGGHVTTMWEWYRLLQHYGMTNLGVASGDWIGNRTGDDQALCFNRSGANDLGNFDGHCDKNDVRWFRCTQSSTANP